METPLLYDLHELKEWDPVEEEVRIPSKYSLLSLVPVLGSSSRKGCHSLPSPSWAIQISNDETRFVIFSKGFAEVYSIPDKLLGRSRAFEEPMSRNIVWSRDSNYFLIPALNGKRFYLFDGFSAHSIYTMSSPSWNGSLAFSGFLGAPKSSTWEDQFLAISEKGKALSLFIGKSGFQEHSTFSFSIRAVTSAVYSKKYNLLIIASLESGLYVLGVWRPLNEEPFFSKVETHTEGSDVHPIIKMCLSPCESKVVSLDSEGTLRIHMIPSLSLSYIIPLEEQPLFDEINPSLLTDPKLSSRKTNFLASDHKWIPYQVEWWNKSSLILSRYSGSISIISVEREPRNLLGDSVEFFADVPCITPRCGRDIFCLEREYEETEEPEVHNQGWLSGFSEGQSRIRSSYRLITMVKMTPDELYQRKIDKEEYGEALVLAEAFGLDGDRVYLRRWHLSEYTTHAQNDFLYKVSNKESVIKECLNVAPNNIHDAKELLQFGLRIAFSEEKPDLEAKFERYIRLLRTYERLLRSFSRQQEIKFNARFFLKFRDASIEESIMKLASLGYWDAVRVLFESHFEEISEVYIRLLSRFPESYSPIEYSFILPFANVKSKEVIYPFGGDKAMRLSYDELVEWYKNRALALESATGLPDNALDLLDFARVHGVEVGPSLRFDLQTVRSLIYELGKSYINLSTYRQMSNAEKVEEFILDANKEVLISSRIQEYLLPFLEAQEDSFNTILKEYFSRSQPRNISFDKEIIFNLPERRIRDPEFVSLCLDSLFRIVCDNDDPEILCEILLLFMEHSESKSLREVYTVLNINVITRKYGYSKSLELGSQEYKDTKYIDAIIKDLCRNPNFLQEFEESKDSGSRALTDILIISKSNDALNPNAVYRSALAELLICENDHVVGLLVESLCCTGVNCQPCLLHSVLRSGLVNERLTDKEVEDLLFNSAESYLRHSGFLGDHNVSLAERILAKCSTGRAKPLRDVLRVGYILHEELGTSLPPSRLLESLNAKDIMSEVIAKGLNYTKHKQISAIASLLSPSEDFGRDVEYMTALQALEAGDFRASLPLVRNMISYSYKPATELCYRILDSAPHLAIADREAFKGFVLKFGEAEQVLAILEGQKPYFEPSSANSTCNRPRCWDEYAIHPFYDPKPRLAEPCIWNLDSKVINKDNSLDWVHALLDYDFMAAVSLLATLPVDFLAEGDTDDKSYLFLRAYVASIQGFSDLLREDVLLIPPKTLIGAAVCESSKCEDHPIQSVMSRFNNYIEARRLTQVDSNIDVVRFVSEEAYKVDTIMGLSMSSDVHCFNLAMKYAADSPSIDPWELCLNFLVSVFHEDPSSLQGVLENNQKVRKILAGDPSRLQAALDKYLYATLNGKNKESLLQYYNILLTLDLIPESRLKHIKKLISKAKALQCEDLDLKAVLENVRSLKTVVNASNLKKVISLAEVLSDINPKVNSGHIYVCLCEKIFEERRGSDEVEQIFEECEEYFRALSEDQLEELIVFLAFKNPSSPFMSTGEREGFLRRFESDFSLGNELKSKIESWTQFNKDVTSLPSLPDDLLRDILCTIGNKAEIESTLIRRVAEGGSSFSQEALPVIERLAFSSTAELYKKSLCEALSQSSSSLQALLSDYDEVMSSENESEITNIHTTLIDWCMNHSEGPNKDVLIEFLRKKCADKESLSLVALHKSRAILSEAFTRPEALLKDLNDRHGFLKTLLEGEEIIQASDKLSAVLKLLCFWGEEEVEELLEWKRVILEITIKERVTPDFVADLDKFSLESMEDLEGILSLCYEKHDVLFAYELMKHAGVFREDMKDALGVLRRRYPLTFPQEKAQGKAPNVIQDYSMPFSLWMKDFMKV